MKVRFLPSARSDLAVIRAWIARDDPYRALSYVRELRARAMALTQYPRRHQLVSETTGASVHKMTHGNYLIYYRVASHGVDILNVRHAARRQPTFA